MDNQGIVPGCNNDFNSILSALTDPPAKKNIDPTIVKTLYEQGYSYTQIAKALKISKNTVFYHMNNMREDREINRFFVKNRTEILQNTQRRLLNSINDEDIKKTPVGSRVLAFAQLYDKERLETDQSTSNQAVMLGLDKSVRQGLTGLSTLLSASKVEQTTADIRDKEPLEPGQSLSESDNFGENDK
jgi:transposase